MKPYRIQILKTLLTIIPLLKEREKEREARDEEMVYYTTYTLQRNPFIFQVVWGL